MMLMESWHRIHRWPWPVRTGLKLALFAAIVTVVLYPKLWLVPRWLDRLGNMDSVLQPDHPALAPVEAIARAKLAAKGEGENICGAVEDAVCESVPYAFDWDTWGVVDYLPTVGEVFEQGREDCDGRAVVAASLLRRMGVNAWLVSDLKHVWVATPEGELMSPGEGAQTMIGKPGGTRTVISAETAANLGRGLAFGVAVFPLGRELIIVATLCLLTLQPRSPLWRRFGGCALLFAALWLFRGAGATAIGLAGTAWLVWSGLLLSVAGWLLLALRGQPRAAGPRAPR